MKEYLNENRYSFIALIIEVIGLFLILIGLIEGYSLLFYIQFVLMIGALILTIVSYIKDKKKMLSIISTIFIVMYILLIIYLIYCFLFVLPETLPIYLDGMMKSFGIGG